MARRNDAGWRRAVEQKRGRWCRVCGTARRLECDHVKSRSQGGRSDVENGMMLCSLHHAQKTNKELKVRPRWLDPDQIVYLATIGWVWWDESGEVYGEGRRWFDRDDTSYGW